MAELYWEPEAARVYESLNDAPARLVAAVENVLDQLVDDPGHESVRRRTRRTTKGDVIWKVDLRRSVEDWTVLWIHHPAKPGDVLVLYLGPAQYQ
ncbi:MAG: hypothetical protein JJD92_04200 [Frankiaceae bacterium]|nr:hypothetical protein [Frankiaceae bacterium]